MSAPLRMPARLDQAYSSVLHPVDFTASGWRALPLAERLSNDLHLPLRLVHVDTVSPWAGDTGDLTLRATPYRKPMRVRVVAARDVGRGIVSAAGNGRPLVVMSSHARSVGGEIVAGSNTESVLRAVDTPIVVVGPHFVRSSIELERIVACVDPGEPAPGLADEIAMWSEHLGLPVEVLTIDSEPPIAGGNPTPAEKWVDETVAALELLGVEAAPVVLHGVRPADDILEYVDFATNTLLVLTTHARGPMSRLLLGSVGRKVVRHSRNPVLLRRRGAAHHLDN